MITFGDPESMVHHVCNRGEPTEVRWNGRGMPDIWCLRFWFALYGGRTIDVIKFVPGKKTFTVEPKLDLLHPFN